LSATESDTSLTNTMIMEPKGDHSWYNDYKFSLSNIRCVKNYETTAEIAAVTKASAEAKAKAEKAVAILKAKAKKGSFTDARDGKTYITVKLGNQTWMAENLSYEAKGSICYGEGGKAFNPETKKHDIPISNSEIQANCQKYGRLYNWKTAKSACPNGWRLPSDAEWDVLVDLADNSSEEGEGAGNMLKASNGWSEEGNGVDAAGFSALPGGRLKDGRFGDIGKHGYWWSSSESSNSKAYSWNMSYRTHVYKNNDDKGFLFSIRCLQD